MHPQLGAGLMSANVSGSPVDERRRPIPVLKHGLGSLKNIMSKFVRCWQPDISSYGSSGVCRQRSDSPTSINMPHSMASQSTEREAPYHGKDSARSSPLSPSQRALSRSVTNVREPHANDVMCGRGGTSNRHSGNLNFRSLVAANKEVYVTLTKKQKMMVARSIVQIVQNQDPPGCFLRKNTHTSLWYDIGVPRSLEKTSQALRERTGKPGDTPGDKAPSGAAQDETTTSDPGTPHETVSHASACCILPRLTDCESYTKTNKMSNPNNLRNPPIAIPQHLETQFRPYRARVEYGDTKLHNQRVPGPPPIDWGTYGPPPPYTPHTCNPPPPSHHYSNTMYNEETSGRVTSYPPPHHYASPSRCAHSQYTYSPSPPHGPSRYVVPPSSCDPYVSPPSRHQGPSLYTTHSPCGLYPTNLNYDYGPRNTSPPPYPHPSYHQPTSRNGRTENMFQHRPPRQQARKKQRVETVTPPPQEPSAKMSPQALQFTTIESPMRVSSLDLSTEMRNRLVLERPLPKGKREIPSPSSVLQSRSQRSVTESHPRINLGGLAALSSAALLVIDEIQTK